jgi:hypothetical protein
MSEFGLYLALVDSLLPNYMERKEKREKIEKKSKERRRREENKAIH